MASPFSPSDYTVLLVDSDPKVCADLGALLERAGYHTQAFDSGESLLKAISRCPAQSCVISEVELPGMTGLELIARLRQRRIEAPVVILTRLADVAIAVQAMRHRVADYLTKPYVERDLIRRLQNALTQPATVH